MVFALEKHTIDIIIDELAKRGIKEEFLEVGCGDGFNLEELSRTGFIGTGIDISRQAIDAARKRNLMNIELICGDFQDYANRQFSLVLLLNTLEHIDKQSLFIKGIHSVLKTDGICIISVPANTKAYGFADFRAGHYRRYDRTDISSLIENNGLSIERIISIGFPVGNIYTWMYNFLSTILYGKPKFESQSNDYIGIEGRNSHLSFPFNYFSSLAYHFLYYFLKIDRGFRSSDLGYSYIIFAKKV